MGTEHTFPRDQLTPFAGYTEKAEYEAIGTFQRWQRMQRGGGLRTEECLVAERRLRRSAFTGCIVKFTEHELQDNVHVYVAEDGVSETAIKQSINTAEPALTIVEAGPHSVVADGVSKLQVTLKHVPGSVGLVVKALWGIWQSTGFCLPINADEFTLDGDSEALVEIGPFPAGMCSCPSAPICVRFAPDGGYDQFFDGDQIAHVDLVFAVTLT